MDELNEARLNLRQVEQLLEQNKVIQDLDDDRNSIEIAFALGLVSMVEVERVETGFFDLVDQRRMKQKGQLVIPIAFGQSVLQAMCVGEES